MAMNPNNLSTLSETSGSLLIIFLNLSGKAKYGNPSIINTRPKTDKKYLKPFPSYGKLLKNYLIFFFYPCQGITEKLEKLNSLS